jgi:colanic acid biosynthesis glycosyl transferase WcaI
MNICFFNRSYWPDQAATGQLLTELAEDLVSRHRCAVSVVAGPALHAPKGGDGQEWQEGREGQEGLEGQDGFGGLVRRESHHGVAILRANSSRFAPARFAGRASNYLTYFASASAASFRIGSPDVVVSLTDPPIIGLTALFAARRTGARFVFLCEDIFPEVAALVDGFHNGAVNATLDRINRYLLREADAVIALGDRMRQRLVEEKGANPGRVHVIHNWADCDAIVPSPKDNAFTRANGLADRFVVMHSGNVGLSQDLDVLIEAADRLRSKERLTIAIVGGGSRREELGRMVAGRGLTNVRFFPYQSKELLHESFGAADAFVVSLKDTLEGYIVPSKVYGILAAGRPYIAATNPGCEAATIARAGGCGLVAAPGDAGALADAIAKLYDDPAAARAMGERARHAAWQYDRRVAVQAYYDLFAQVVGAARAA